MTSSLPPAASDFSTTGQLAPEDMAEVARAGYRSVINNRPDAEGGASQPTSEALRRAAEAAGLRYAHQPVVFSKIGEADVETFARLFETLDKPVLGFCRTGGRSRRLHELASAPRRT